MGKKSTLFLEVVVALVALVIGYVFIVGQPAIDTPAVAHPDLGPDNPLILYLAPAETQRGVVNKQKMVEKNFTPLQSWSAARTMANSKPLAAMLIDAAMFEVASTEDIAWLQTQFRAGVVIVSLGLEDNKLAQTLGLKTLRSPDEANIPIGPTGYRLVNSYVFGQPEDVKKLEESDWLNRVIGQDTDTPSDIKYPLVGSFRSARGELNSDDDLELLYLRLNSELEDVEQNRQQMQQNSEEK